MTPIQRASNLKRSFEENDIPWPKTKTLFWHETGPLMNYIGDILRISSLNPEKHIQFRMTRKEMVILGCRCIKAGLSSSGMAAVKRIDQ